MVTRDAVDTLLDTPAARLLIERIEESQRAPVAPEIEAIVEQLRAGREREVAAILFYGSYLFAETRARGSFPDFYLLSDGPARYRRSLLDAALSRVLPPNVYDERFGELRCKVCVISLRRFLEETSPRASDLHHLGRFSKRFTIAHARDEATRAALARAALSAILALLPSSLALLPERFDLESLILTQLGLSYLGEQRVTEPDKVRKLYLAARDHYHAIYPAALSLHASRSGIPEEVAPGRYRQPAPSPLARLRVHAFIQRSRIRGVLRWPKYVLTVESWVDYLVEKLERHHGFRLELSERERRHPLIFGWRHLFELRRRGIVG